MSTDDAHSKRRTASNQQTRHTKEDALDTRAFELLLEGCYRMNGYYALQCQFVVLVAGRLGLRAGEIAHMTDDWIDWRRNMICIPRHETCTNGHNDTLCAYCEQCAAQKAAHADGDASAEEYYQTMWSPKTDAAAREVPFDADPRACIIVERFFERFDEYPHGRQSVNRRVNRAARFADEVVEDDVYPHALRATAASYFAGRGLDVFALTAMLGWADFQTAECYISDSGERTAQAIRDIQV